MASSYLTCPHCTPESRMRLVDFDSMIVIMPDYALFTLRCPTCGKLVSSIRLIPDELRDEVQFAAIEVGAGMGRMS